VRILEKGYKQIGGLDQPAAAFVSMFERIGQERPQRLGHFDAATEVLSLVEFGFKRLEHNLRIEVQALHHFIEERTLDLGNGNEDVIGGELAVVTSPRLFVRPSDEPPATLSAFVGVRFQV
jgi:hypothetical protein